MTSKQEATTDDAGRSAHEEHVVVFRLSTEYYAVEIHAVQEIVRMQSITAIPGSDPWLEGITNLRGRVVPVIDLRRRCSLPAGDHTSETRIVVVTTVSGVFGLIVDAVSEVVRIPATQVESTTGIVGGSTTAFLRGIAKVDDRLISLMDLAGVLPGAAVSGAEELPQLQEAA